MAIWIRIIQNINLRLLLSGIIPIIRWAYNIKISIAITIKMIIFICHRSLPAMIGHSWLTIRTFIMFSLSMPKRMGLHFNSKINILKAIIRKKLLLHKKDRNMPTIKFLIEDNKLTNLIFMIEVKWSQSLQFQHNLIMRHIHGKKITSTQVQLKS